MFWVVLGSEQFASLFHVSIRAVLWQYEERNSQLLHFLFILGLCYGNVMKQMVSFLLSDPCSGIAKEGNGYLLSFVSISDVKKKSAWLYYLMSMICDSPPKKNSLFEEAKSTFSPK